jgi:hypothetical protein
MQPCFCKCKYLTIFETVDDGAWGGAGGVRKCGLRGEGGPAAVAGPGLHAGQHRTPPQEQGQAHTNPGFHKPRLSQPPALTTPGSHNPRLTQTPAFTNPGFHKPRLSQPPALAHPSKMTFEVGKKFLGKQQVYAVQKSAGIFVCVCGKGRIHERWHANCMPIQRHLWSCGENCIFSAEGML